MKKSKKIAIPVAKPTRIFFLLYLLATNSLSFAQPCTPPTASISLISPSVCQGNPAYLRLDAATGQGPYNLTVNGINYVNVNVGEQFGPLSTSDISIWNNSFTPDVTDAQDGAPLEIGVKFRSAINGYIRGIRFFKGATNIGVHIGSLWSADGTLLARASFITETASGWQEVLFSSPVAINANTTYVASYFSQNGGYSYSNYYFNGQDATNGPLTALQSGVDGLNGVFKYNAGFPDQSVSDNNYAVDVLFAESVNGSVNNYILTALEDANGCTNTGNLGSAVLTINPYPAGTLSLMAPSVCEGQPISLNFDATSGTGPFTIVTNNISNSNINSNQPFPANITAAQPDNTPVSIWSGALPAGLNTTVVDNNAVEIGVKFRSSVSGAITALRFYKRVENTGTHTGSIWSSNGTLLGTATFTSESASGWQEVSFSTPVTIVPNQIFTASYYAESGGYVFSPQYFNDYAATNGPLTAVDGNGLYGNNGVYEYGAGGVMPASSYNNTNYWVDVVFVPNQGHNVINMTEITDANGCTLEASPIQSLDMPSGQCIPLPVTLTDFRISVQHQSAKLDWETASENNNKGFEIQRTLNYNTWQTIGFVKGAGTSAIMQSYTFTDAGLPAGKYFYRLRQVDVDGKFTFSKILSADINGSLQSFLGQNYPNPVAQQNTTINYAVASPSIVNISLYDVQGRIIKILVNETKTPGQYLLPVNLSALMPGTYYYKMRTKDFTDTKKLVIGNR